MKLTPLISNDSTWVKNLINPAYAITLNENDIKDSVSKADVAIGDNTIPIYLRIIYYDLKRAVALPVNIVDGFSSQVADLHTPSTDWEKVIIPTLAEGLGQMIEKIPDSVNNQVWAFLDPDTV